MLRRSLFVCLVAPLLVGCVMHAQQLRTLPINTTATIEPSHQSTARILVHPFDDLRGSMWGKTSATAQIPVVSLFHEGLEMRYPEHSGGVLRQGRTFLVGEMTTALPALLATTMRKMKLSPMAITLDEAGPQVDLDDFHYIVVGNLRTTRLVQQWSTIGAVAVGVLGAPYRRADYDLEYEVVLYRADDRTRPLWRRTYRFSDWRVGGLYYNHGSERQLFVHALEQTLPQVVQDLALATHSDGGRPARELSQR